MTMHVSRARMSCKSWICCPVRRSTCTVLH